ncbi:GAF domain-containing protein [Radicibacter daui]|uniref:GAF domain-containing protein n=1 Tax=Radicibacter daui TaxID=3064829 RepID=UPI004046BA07
MKEPSGVRHAAVIEAAVSSDAAATSALVASWTRCSNLHHLDPSADTDPTRLGERELSQARGRLEPLIAVAQPCLDRLYQAVGGSGCCVLLADSDGVPVERRGSSVDDANFRAWGLWPGAIWSEESEGTNGIGTCLVEQRPVLIHRDQHFFTRNTGLSCTTAPIHDHEGRLVAALDVSSCRADFTEGFAQLTAMAVADAAMRIEAENFRRAFPGARIQLVPGRSSAALIAIDRDDLVVGATRSARLALGITDQRLKRPLPAADLTGEGQEGAVLESAERAALQRALARAGGNVSAAASTLGISRATLHRKLARLGIGRAR